MADEQKGQNDVSAGIKNVSSDSKHDNAINLIEDNADDKTLTDRETDDEPQFHSAEEDDNDDVENDSNHAPNIELKLTCPEKVEESPVELIDEDGGGEGIAETVEIEKEFLDKELLDVSEDDDKQEQSNEPSEKEQAKEDVVYSKEELEKKVEESNVKDDVIKDDTHSQGSEKITIKYKENDGINNEDIKCADNKKIERVDNENIQHVDNTNIEHVDNTNIEHVDNENIQHVDNKDIEHVNNKNIEQVDSKNIEHVGNENIKHVDNEYIQHVDNTNIEHVSNENIKHVDNKNIEHVDNKDMEHVDNKIIKCVNSEDIEHVDNEIVEHVDNEEIKHVYNEDIEHVDEDIEYEGVECEANPNEEEEYDEEEGEEGEYVEDEECGDEEDEVISDEDGDEDEEGCIDGDEGTFVEGERQQGDGEECDPTASEKELDFDEDRRNPQYIPKKGIFYEHDDRIIEAPKEKEADPARDKKKKKLWSDDGKWGHDRYREDEQIPKSRDELIEAYGYDIRCEDGPPRARRRRRYGRGPTKYEPNWEEEEEDKSQRKERTLGMFIRRGTRGGRVRGGRSRGGTFRGTGRPYNKMDNENSINNNIESFKSNDKRSYQSFPPKQQRENFPARENREHFSTRENREHFPARENREHFPARENREHFPARENRDHFPSRESRDNFHSRENRENISSKPNMNKPNNETNLCGWEDEFPTIHASTQKKTVNVGGQELANFKITTSNSKEKKGTNENLSGWESDEEAKCVNTKKEENICGWESEGETKPLAKQKKEENFSGWESDENPTENPVHSAVNNKEFSSIPTKETSLHSLPTDRNSAFIRKNPTFVPKESQEKSSVRTQTFENSSFSNNKPSFPSYEKPPRHEGLRGLSRGSRRTIRGRPTRGSERYSSNESYIKPTVGPRLLDKQMNRVNTELERLNLNNRNDPHENIERLAAYEQKQNINIKGNINRPHNLISSSKNEDSAGRSKRYSHMRQKTLPETSNYQSSPTVPSAHAPYYDTGYQPALYASDAVAPNPQPPSSSSPPVINPPQYQPYSSSPYGVPIPVANQPRLYPQVTVPAGPPINMTPSPCTITPTASLINYSAPPTAQPPYPPQYAYQQFTQPTPPPVEFQGMGHF